MDETLKCYHSNESYRAVRSCGTIYSTIKVVLTFASVDEILKCDNSNESFIEQYFPVVLFLMSCKLVQTFESVDKIIHSSSSKKANEQFFPVVLCCTRWLHSCR